MRAFAWSCLCVVVAAQAAWATTIHADFVLVQNGSAAVFGDLFDGPALNSPPWIPTGSPGPQAGGLLEMKGGDQIVAALSLDAQADVISQAMINLTDFAAGDSAVALSVGAESDNVGLVVTPTFSFVGNGGGLLGVLPLDPGTAALLSIGIDPLGNILATVNGTTIYDGPGAGPLNIDSIRIQVVPEPSTALAGLLLAGVALRRRNRRS